MKGWIGLDIDGTITLDKYSVPEKVVSFLQELSSTGWNIAIATGRAYEFAVRAVDRFDFPFHFIVQNGAAALQMPGKRALFRHYMSCDKIAFVEEAFEGLESDFLISAGFEKGDFCYYRPHRFSTDGLSYIEELKKRQSESWREKEAFDHQEIGLIPLIKCFGSKTEMKQVAERLRKKGCFQVTQIHDTHAVGIDVLLITDLKATKGLGLKEVMGKSGGKLIVAGDDENDVSMFDVADIAIAMPHAPKSVLAKADLIAPPTNECGIIAALREAIDEC